ncbi:MAG: cohesin domain-containing protein [Acidobacteriota bacterium]|nr:cohesin domain-containing protein [Acidobacteriota bacterium]
MTRGFSLLKSSLSSSLRSAWLVALLVLIAAAAAPSAHGQSASGWNKRGQDAELHEDYDTAYECYLKAHQKSPKDLRYTARVDRMRFQAAATHVDRGRMLRQSGDLAGALNQFTRALQIDPSNESASQEIQITKAQDNSPGASNSPPQATPSALAALRDVNSVSAPIRLKPISNDPITLHTVGDVKDIYTAIGKIAGLNVLFDPDYQSRRIPVDLMSVSLSDALRVVGTIAGTFYKPITPDTIFIAASTRQKHTDLDDVAVQTFYLTNAAQQADANEIVTALRNVLQPEDKVYLVASQNAIVMRAPPEHLVLAEKLLNDLDRTRAEVVVDIAILEVNRDKMRNLGITLPTSFGITPQSSSTASTTTGTGTGTTTGTGTATSSNFTLNTLANINATNFAVTIGGGQLNALLSDSDTRVLQNPSIRATDGQNAKLKIGSKIPIATGSYSAGAATGITAGIGVQTQFTYTDIGVVIDMTPTIHLDREVSLKLSVDVSTHAGDVTISGITEPIIGQRSDSTTIQLRDGEPCLLAGILTKSDTDNSNGTPGLSQIPFLKYFFGSVFKETAQDEVVFILIPHIVRESVLTGLNTRAIDTGTMSTIEIRHSDALLDDSASMLPKPPAASNMTAANAASAMVQQMKQQAMPPTPGTSGAPAGSPTGAQVAAGLPVMLTVLPRDSTHPLGSTFTASILLSGAHDVFSVPVQIQFDPKVLELVNVDAGGLLGGDGQPVALVHRDEGNGLVTISASRPPGVNGVDGQGDVCTLTFKAVGPGDTTIKLVKMAAQNSLRANLPTSGVAGVVHVK